MRAVRALFAIFAKNWFLFIANFACIAYTFFLDFLGAYREVSQLSRELDFVKKY